jgi:hypothetical protein
MRASRWTIGVGGGALAAGAIAALLAAGDGDGARTRATAPPRLPAHLPVSAEAVQVPRVVGAEAARVVALLEESGVEVALGRHEGRDPAGCVVAGQSRRGATAPGAEVVLALRCDEADWRRRDGTAWRLFDAAYAAGWDEGCDRAFAAAGPEYRLFAGDEALTPADCRIDNPDGAEAAAPGRAPADPVGAGLSLGRVDGCRNAFRAAPDGRLHARGRPVDARGCTPGASRPRA